MMAGGPRARASSTVGTMADMTSPKMRREGQYEGGGEVRGERRKGSIGYHVIFNTTTINPAYITDVFDYLKLIIEG